LVAIFYSIVQNVNSQQNIGEMRTLVSEASRIMTEKADTLVDVAEQLRRSPMAASTTTTTLPGKPIVSVPFDLTPTSDLTRLFVLFLLRSCGLKRTLPVEQFVGIVKPLVRMSPTELSSHVYGILHGLACCLMGFLYIEGQTKVQLRDLPDNFKHHVEGIAEAMKTRSPDLEHYLVIIDSIS
jgi:hypothetical protein